MKNLKELLEHEVQDLYSAETQLVEALPKMIKAANHPKLKQAIEKHLQETEGQIKRLEQVARLMDISAKSSTKCKGMEGLLAEGEKMLKEDAEPEVRDAAIIGAAQKVEHYEIAGYGTARYYAQLLGEDEVAGLLEETLDEEKMTDDKLNTLAKDKVNELAVKP